MTMAGNFIRRMKIRSSNRVVPEEKLPEITPTVTGQTEHQTSCVPELPTIQQGHLPQQSTTTRVPQTATSQEGSLRRARDKTAINTKDKLLSLNEELRRENAQLAEKNAELCREVEERQRRINILAHENHNLHCRVLQQAGENQELLRKNRALHAQQDRTATIVGAMVNEQMELQLKIDSLRFEKIALTEEKEDMMKEFTQRLRREKHLRELSIQILKEKERQESHKDPGGDLGGSTGI